MSLSLGLVTQAQQYLDASGATRHALHLDIVRPLYLRDSR